MTKKKFLVEWTIPALADLKEAAAFIRRDNPTAAKSFYQEVLRRTDPLESYAMLGRIVPEYGDELRGSCTVPLTIAILFQ